MKRFSIESLANTAFVIRNKETIEPRDVSDSLRRTETSDRVKSLALAQIEHFNGVIAERANEQSFAGGIKRKMIDPPFDAW